MGWTGLLLRESLTRLDERIRLDMRPLADSCALGPAGEAAAGRSARSSVCREMVRWPRPYRAEELESSTAATRSFSIWSAAAAGCTRQSSSTGRENLYGDSGTNASPIGRSSPPAADRIQSSSDR